MQDFQDKYVPNSAKTPQNPYYFDLNLESKLVFNSTIDLLNSFERLSSSVQTRLAGGLVLNDDNFSYPCQESNPCQNSGICVNSENLESQKCICQEHWIGENCEIDDSGLPCSFNPCENNGICENLSETEFTCECDVSQFFGETCSKLTNGTYFLSKSVENTGMIIGSGFRYKYQGVIVSDVDELYTEIYQNQYGSNAVNSAVNQSGSMVTVNACKISQIGKTEGVLDYSGCVSSRDFAYAQNMNFRGHVLVWFVPEKYPDYGAF